MVGVPRVELGLTAPKAVVLPSYSTPINILKHTIRLQLVVFNKTNPSYTIPKFINYTVFFIKNPLAKQCQKSTIIHIHTEYSDNQRPTKRWPLLICLRPAGSTFFDSILHEFHFY